MADTGYSTVVVGTDGSQTSLRAVERAADIAGVSVARLVIVCGYEPVLPCESRIHPLPDR